MTDTQTKPSGAASSPHTHPAHRAGHSRSPCPALNAMANHGYLPLDGRDISLPTIIRTVREAYHLTWPLVIVLSVFSYILVKKWWKLDLEDLALHNGVEHDGSLAHDDADPHNCPAYAPTTVNASLVNQLMEDSADGKVMTAVDFARARVRREALYKPGDIDGLHLEIARGEVAAILLVFGAGKAVPLDVLRAWLEEEKFPDGWIRPEKRVGLLDAVRGSREIKRLMTNLREQNKRL